MAAENQLLLDKRWRHYREPALLAASAGAIDTISFITLFGLFTAHVTGNLVVVGAFLAGENEGIVIKLLAIPVFMISVAFTTLIIKTRKCITPTFLVGLFMSEVFLLLLFAWLYVVTFCWQPDGLTTLVTGMTGVMGMGVRNATSRLLLSITSPSTMMTGNVTQLTIDIINYFQIPSTENHTKLIKSGSSVIGFLAGAGLGTLGYILMGFFSVLIPVIMIVAVIYKEVSYVLIMRK